ncbi:superoxide dismutase [Alkalihalobacillus trypoxylicola]|uniref:superoxide dismutase n=1 Tax=Alkalihalobacillus trypoxylicola TaxID=519424 RepID=A0A162ELD9_9BACI|nr:superoxide dismutase [Alkalihalobacillus trypoxylicola]KYG33173.1 superoxide dismutase [Alkalihalobacillus trypoxylicola]
MSAYYDEMKHWVSQMSSLSLDSHRSNRSEEIMQHYQESLKNLENALDKEEDEVTLNQLAHICFRAYQNWMEKGSERVPIGGHVLPPLPYSYDALEPIIAEEIMYLHHDKHHQSYVDGLNKAELALQQARENSDYSLVKHWERELAFHGAGHYLHSLFWEIMTPSGGGQPVGRLARQINEDFGSFEQMKNHFTEAANQVEGGGWAMLVWSPRSKRLEILQAEKHQNLSQQDMIPLLVLDVWEHAYYLQYKNEKKKYIENWWNIVNWRAVSDRFDIAEQVVWKTY